MYELQKSPFGQHTVYDLFNPETGNGFRLAPSVGATMLDLRFGGKNILDGYETPDELEAGKWGKSSLLFPFPNRLKDGKYEWLGKTYQFPINNAATGNAIHGFLRGEALEVEYVFLSRSSAAIRCFFDYLGDKPYYPFPFSFEVEFQISDQNKLEMTVSVENFHHAPIPVGFGWHPYFRLAESANQHQLKLPSCEQVIIDDRMIPTGGRTLYKAFQQRDYLQETVLDNCFQHSKTTGMTEVCLSGEAGSLKMKAAAQEYPFFQVFTPPHRESVALEPMTGNVDVFNNRQGLVALEPDKKWQGKVVLEWR